MGKQFAHPTATSLLSAEFFASTRRLPAAARRRTVVHRVRAVRQRQHIFLLLVVQAVSDFGGQKNSRISHQTCKFVQRVEGQLFLDCKF